MLPIERSVAWPPRLVSDTSPPAGRRRGHPWSVDPSSPGRRLRRWLLHSLCPLLGGRPYGHDRGDDLGGGLGLKVSRMLAVT